MVEDLQSVSPTRKDARPTHDALPPSLTLLREDALPQDLILVPADALQHDLVLRPGRYSDPSSASRRRSLRSSLGEVLGGMSRLIDVLKQILKMEKPSVPASTAAVNEGDSPTVDLKYSSFRDICLTPSLQDSGYNELLQIFRFDNTGKEIFGKKEEGPTLVHEHPETSSLDLMHPVESPSQKKRFIFPWKEKEKSPELCETPKVSGKKCLLRRRLNRSFALLQGDVESQNTSIESSESQVLSVEKRIPSSASRSPRQNNFSPLVTSTLRTEEATSSSQKLRLNFSQQKTSTIDDSKDDCSLFEVECISPIQGSTSKDSITHAFSDSSLSLNDENTYPELLGSSVSRKTHGTDEDVFVTPISHLVENIKFNTRQTPPPPTEVRGNASTPEDSGFNSLSLDKSEDSASDQEGSFQELLQKHKGALRAGDSIGKSRRLVRLRRLSTLREQGSQSETEEEKQIAHSSSETTPAAAADLSESRDWILSVKNVSNTPALQLVQELFMNSKRKRYQQNSTHKFLEERDEGNIAALQCVLAGLIGKKMGLEKLDILTELKHRNLKHILAVVLESLAAESLCSGYYVLLTVLIAEITMTDISGKFPCSPGAQRIVGHNNVFEYFFDFEVGPILNVEDAATRLHLLNRSALRSVQALARTPGLQKEQVPTLSPWGEVLTPITSSSLTPLSRKQEEYVKVAKTLFIDEALKPCPRCQSPAKYQPYKKRGLCSRTACGFDFCVSCLCAYHGSEDCGRRASVPRNRKGTLPGSVQSKRNLKRL
ncbi:PREDICTED: F-box only protein 43 [Chrysochloris asiatica]|uniref:F-box only protein 43 n=1 Tax=Chrysochloris asiatica TaxID=185453 RepID=A0A9B0T8A9_CHRAS|nr:PREDICTED: F-box only protein 43 [Chrysochloris asiatica]